MNKKIGFVVASTLFLIVVLSTPLAFAQPWDTCNIDVQAELYSYCGPGENFRFDVIEPNPGTPNKIVVSGLAGDFTYDLKIGDSVIVSVGGLIEDQITYSEGTGHLIYYGPADSVTINAVEIPEFPPFLILPLFMIATMLAAIVLRRKLTS